MPLPITQTLNEHSHVILVRSKNSISVPAEEVVELVVPESSQAHIVTAPPTVLVHVGGPLVSKEVVRELTIVLIVLSRVSPALNSEVRVIVRVVRAINIIALAVVRLITVVGLAIKDNLAKVVVHLVNTPFLQNRITPAYSDLVQKVRKRAVLQGEDIPFQLLRVVQLVRL